MRRMKCEAFWKVITAKSFKKCAIQHVVLLSPKLTEQKPMQKVRSSSVCDTEV